MYIYLKEKHDVREGVVGVKSMHPLSVHGKLSFEHRFKFGLNGENGLYRCSAPTMVSMLHQLQH